MTPDFPDFLLILHVFPNIHLPAPSLSILHIPLGPIPMSSLHEDCLGFHSKGFSLPLINQGNSVVSPSTYCCLPNNGYSCALFLGLLNSTSSPLRITTLLITWGITSSSLNKPRQPNMLHKPSKMFT